MTGPHHRTGALRSGYTTGACAAAAARGAALLLAGNKPAGTVEIVLPAGQAACFTLHGERLTAAGAACFVVKDAGDDPDVTHGVEVHAEAVRTDGNTVAIRGGTGIGRVTKPGLAVPPGEWAINPVPRRMIEAAVRSVFPDGGIDVAISIPDGEERARKTLNERLGIIGGLSILGTSGIVRPISAKAWTDTLDAALDVARACACPTVVLSTGRSSELAAQTYLAGRHGAGDEAAAGQRSPDCLPDEAYVMMGDHVAYTLAACAQRGFSRPYLACQFAKLLKIACGHANTHAAASELDLATLRDWALRDRLPAEIIALIERANTARQIAVESGFAPPLLALVAREAQRAVTRHAPDIAGQFLVCDYEGQVIWPSQPPPGDSP